jgi:hypothetical protein
VQARGVVERSLIDSSSRQRAGTFFASSFAVFSMDHPPYSPNLTPADFWLFPEHKSILKGKRFSEVEAIKSSVKKNEQTFAFRILKTVLKNIRGTGNITNNWMEITLKNSMLLISASLKIHF